MTQETTAAGCLFVPFYDKKGGLSVCKLLGISRTTAKEVERTAADFPKPIIFSPTCKRYRLADVQAWAEAKRGADLTRERGFSGEAAR